MVRTNVIKLRDLCLRSIRSTSFGGDKTYDYYDMVTQLEKVAAALLRLSKVSKNKTALFTKMSESFQDSYRCYLSKEFSKALKVKKANIDLLFNINNDIKQFYQTEKLSAAHVYEILYRIKQINSRLLSICSN